MRSNFRFLRGLVCLLSLWLGACTPLLHPPGPRIGESRLGPAHFTAADGAVLPVRAWPPRAERPQAVIVALHGFNDYSQAFDRPAQFLREQGMAVYAYDQRGFGNAPGHGLWAGTDAYAADLREFVGAVRRRHPGIPVYVLGESMGGAVAIAAATAGPPLPVEGVILSAPGVWSRDTMPWYQAALLAVLAHAAPDLRLTGEGLEILASDNIEALRELGRDPLVIKATRMDAVYGLVDLMDQALERSRRLTGNVLVLYGEKDEVIPKAPMLRMLDLLPKGPETRMAFYPKGYHLLLRDLGAGEPLGDIVAWIEDRRRPLPSGGETRAAQAMAGDEGDAPETPWPARGGAAVSENR
jgi:acylglycerol lipase